MNVLSWLVATLFLSPFLLAAPTSTADAPPTTFDEASKTYRFIQSAIIDIDKMLTDAGIKIHSCRLENGSPVNYPGVGSCIYESVKFTFEQKKASRIWLWVLNDKGQYLPPLLLEWQNTHNGLFKLGGEFLFLSFENFFGYMTKKANRVSSVDGKSTCDVSSPTDRDLGNFIGDISITIPKGRKISEYFILNNIDGFAAEKISLHATMPFYLNKKRAYKITAIMQNGQQESIQVSMVTNYNLVSQRQSCFKGSLEHKSKDSEGPSIP
jgi:hypothetical protein